MQDKEKIIINDYIQGDPLHENNLDGVVNLVNKIRPLMQNKTIWLYTGYKLNIYEQYNCDHLIIETTPQSNNENDFKREKIIRSCDVIVDGRYIDSHKDITLRWKGSSNQRVIDVQKSLKEGRIILWD